MAELNGTKTHDNLKHAFAVAERVDRGRLREARPPESPRSIPQGG